VRKKKKDGKRNWKSGEVVEGGAVPFKPGQVVVE
jgi:hypothetical protein